MAGKQSIEQELLKLLRFGGLQKENLAALVKVVAGFHDSGKLKAIRVFPRGIPPIYDGLEVKSVVPASDVGQVVEYLASNPFVGGIHIFPIGIPYIDFAEVVASVGPSPSPSTNPAAQATGG